MCRSCSQLFGWFLQMNILLQLDASVNREAAAVYRVRMKSQCSLALHSKCISTCKYTVEWQRTQGMETALTYSLQNIDLYRVGMCLYISLNSAVYTSKVISCPARPNKQQTEVSMTHSLFLGQRKWLEISVSICCLFILTLRLKCFTAAADHLENSL